MASAPISFYERVDKGIHDDVMRRALANGTSSFTVKREAALGTLPNPDDLRDQARLMRRHTIANLDRYLAQFAEGVERAGGVVHWALDAEQARQIVLDIAQRNNVQRIIKSKSMVTEEIHLNAALEANNLEVVETDLGEFIAQLDHDHPSHIIVPVLHKTRQQIGRLFTDKLGVEYTDDPTTLAKIARRIMRQKFLAADMGISGVNFGVASTGTLTIVTNEGNGRMSTTMPRLHVAMMGIERLVPTPADLTLGLQLLARSATGQKLTVYTTFITGPKRAADGDGPEQLHVVLVDNGRSNILRTDLAEILTCIRCGACLNACPVYRAIGGHAYGHTYPGPMGSILSPLFGGLEQYGNLPHASSLCGACRDVCPVRIDLPELLLRLRNDTVEAGMAPAWLSSGIKAYTQAATHPWLWKMGARVARKGAGAMAQDGWIRQMPGPLSAWTETRDFPALVKESFQERWAKRKENVKRKI
jgi:L-lactate dehydrogenase complex protein LldF